MRTFSTVEQLLEFEEYNMFSLSISSLPSSDTPYPFQPALDLFQFAHIALLLPLIWNFKQNKATQKSDLISGPFFSSLEEICFCSNFSSLHFISRTSSVQVWKLYFPFHQINIACIKREREGEKAWAKKVIWIHVFGRYEKYWCLIVWVQMVMLFILLRCCDGQYIITWSGQCNGIIKCYLFCCSDTTTTTITLTIYSQRQQTRWNAFSHKLTLSSNWSFRWLCAHFELPYRTLTQSDATFFSYGLFLRHPLCRICLLRKWEQWYALSLSLTL